MPTSSAEARWLSPDDGICTLKYPYSDDGSDDMMDYQWECSKIQGTCAQAGCDEIYDEDQCKSTDGCTFDPDYYECYNASNIDCSVFYEQDQCTSHSQCSFSKYSDVLKGSACLDDYDDTEGICHKSGENPVCQNLPAYESSCCPDFCSWDDNEMMCADKDAGGGGVSKSCASYGLAGHGNFDDACPSSCDIVKGLCVDKGTSLSCDDICEELACDGVKGVSTGCKWKTQDSNIWEGECVEGTASQQECVGSTEDECYENMRCVYISGGDAGEGLCLDAVCSDMSEELCKANEPSCRWDLEGGNCFFSDMTPECSSFYSDCPTNNGCKLFQGICNDYDSYCVEQTVSDKSQLPCEYFDEPDCCGQQSNCNWDSNAYTCALNKAIEPGVPTLDGTGNRDPQVCLDKKTGSSSDQAYYAKAEAALNDAALDCAGSEYDFNNAKATNEQLQCLAHYVVDVANTDFKSICPCLYLWADKINPENDHWMQIDC